MLCSFRVEPPASRPDSLVRPRLVRALLGRWHHRVTAVVGGAGLGKTTLLIHALAENRLAPHGEDVWIGVEPQDAGGDTLAQAAAIAMGRSDGEPPDPATVADEVWRRSPSEVCLVLDDVQRLPAGSAGAVWLAELVDRLPGNGHVVLISREEPPIPLARLRTQGAVFSLDEDDLCFSDEELVAFAAARGVKPEQLAGTGGWPALAELAASVNANHTGAYLWEEVLEPVGAERRRVLAAVCDLGGADDQLASAALGVPVELSRALEGVPLVAAGANGWFVPHALWHTAPGIALAAAERAEVRGRAVAHLTERGHFDEAFTLLSEAGLWDLAEGVLRAACLASDRVKPNLLERWLSRSPEAVRASPIGCLATSLQTAISAPRAAIEPLRKTAALCRAAGDPDAELVAIGQLGRLAWFRQDSTVVGPELALRVDELAAAGHPKAQGLAAFGRATIADLAGDDTTVLAELAGLETGALDPVWEVMTTWLCGVAHLGLGDTETVCEMVERLASTTDPGLRIVIDGLRLRAWWSAGRVEEVLDGTPAMLSAVRASGVAAACHLAMTITSVMFSYVGDVAAARRCLDEGVAADPRRPDPRTRSLRAAFALASLQLAEGDEDQAAATLREAIDAHGLDRGVDRRGWRHTLSLSYILVPETRKYWDDLAPRGYLQTTKDLAIAVVAVRAGRAGEHLSTLEIPHPQVIRTALHHRFAAELAIGLTAAGRPEAAPLLESLGPAGRAVVRSTAAAGSQSAKTAKALLAAVPEPPPRPTYLAVLGPLTLREDSAHGAEMTNPALRRTRVQELLAFLVAHRTTTRAAITAALWPHLDEEEARNNLAVTLSHMLHALEPWRSPREPPYLVRLDSQSVKLVTDQYLIVDVDEFDHHLAAAAHAEAEATASVALEHYLAAVALYRDTLYADLADTSWIALDREYYSTRFVRAATRAAQLLLGRHDIDRAETVARRAIDVDPWAEDAHGVLVAASLARGDFSSARRKLQHCLTMLADLGVEPSDTTRQLQRRVRNRPSTAHER